MARSTLPEFDPLAQLGIHQSAAAEPEVRPAQRGSRLPVATPKPSPVAAELAETLPAAPAVTEPETPEARVAAAREAPVSRPETASQAAKPQGRAKPQLSIATSSTAAPRVLKAKTSGRISAEVWEEVRDCVVWHGHTMTIDRFTEVAFREHLKRLRKEYSLSDRFPAREHDPKHGRRVG